jgi:uncharacterized cupin superfamily protein
VGAIGFQHTRLPRATDRCYPMGMATTRPPFIVTTDRVPESGPARYPNSSEDLRYRRSIGTAAGLQRIGLHVDRLPPGHRLSWPHAEEKEEEFVLVLAGEVDAWIDGELHRMTPGDLAAFPAGTGICHTFLNNTDRDATLLVGGSATRTTTGSTTRSIPGGEAISRRARGGTTCPGTR